MSAVVGGVAVADAVGTGVVAAGGAGGAVTGSAESLVGWYPGAGGVGGCELAWGAEGSYCCGFVEDWYYCDGGFGECE